jgi:hypothetical protein
MGQSNIADSEEGKSVDVAIPDHTQIEWYEHEREAVSQIVEAKKKTGLTYKQLLQLAAVTVEDSSEDKLKSLIGEVQMQSS